MTMRDDKPDVNWDALEQRIVAAARFRLADRAARAAVPAGWRAPASRWARIAIPAALAASLALAAGLAFGPAADRDLVLEDVMAVAASQDLPADPLAGADQAAFLSTLLDPEE
jgi:hypothetical protein